MAAIVFLVPLFFSWFFWSFEVFILNKAVLFRLLLFLALSVFIARTLLLQRVRLPVFKARPIFIFLFALALSFLLSWILSLDRESAFFGIHGREQGLYSLLSYIIFALLLIFSLRKRAMVERLMISASLASFLACLYGLAQISGLDPINWIESVSKTGRIFSSLGQPNFFGHFLVITAPLSAYLAFFSQERSRYFKTFFLLILILNIVCLFLTYSRAAWVAFVVSFLFLAFVFLNYYIRKKRLFWISAGIAFVLLFFLSCLFFSFTEGNTMAAKRLASFFDPNTGSAASRIAYWKTGVQQILEFPPKRLFFGLGPDMIGDVYASNYQISWSLNERLGVWPNRAHNLFLDGILQFGLLAMFAWAAFFIFLGLKTIKFLIKDKQSGDYWLVASLSASILAYCINNLFSFSSITHYIYLFFLIVSLVFTLNKKRGERNREFNWPLWSRAALITAFIFLFSTMAFFYDIRMILADHQYMLSRKKKESPCLDLWERNNRAVYLNPARDFYKYKLLYKSVECLEKEKRTEVRKALASEIDSLAEGVSRKGAGLKLSLSLASVKGVLGNDGYKNRAKEARALFLKLKEKYPNIPSVHRQYAYFEIIAGNNEHALSAINEYMSRLPRLDPFPGDPARKKDVVREIAKLYELSALAYEGSGQIEPALSAYKKTVELDPRHLPVYDKIIQLASSLGKRETIKYYKEQKKKYE